MCSSMVLHLIFSFMHLPNFTQSKFMIKQHEKKLMLNDNDNTTKEPRQKSTFNVYMRYYYKNRRPREKTSSLCSSGCSRSYNSIIFFTKSVQCPLSTFVFSLYHHFFRIEYRWVSDFSIFPFLVYLYCVRFRVKYRVMVVIQVAIQGEHHLCNVKTGKSLWWDVWEHTDIHFVFLPIFSSSLFSQGPDHATKKAIASWIATIFSPLFLENVVIFVCIFY